MADGIVQLAPDSTGKKVDTSEITVGANTVERQRIVISDNTAAANFATVKAASTTPVAADGALVVTNSPNAAPPSSATATLSTVAGSITTVSLLAANAARKGVYVVNEGSTQVMYIAFAATASLTAYTIVLQPGAIWNPDVITYTGAMSAIWYVAGANARVTELTN